MKPSLEDVMPPAIDESARVPFAGGWARHAQMATWHWYDAAWGWSLCGGNYMTSVVMMDRGDGSSPECCTGCAVKLADRRLHAA